MENQETLTDICEELRSGEYAPLADRIEAARKREGVCRRSIKIPVEVVPTCSMAAIRETLELLNQLFDSCVLGTHSEMTADEMDKVDELYFKTKAALSVPPRNCDVGTAEEQDERFKNFCLSYYEPCNVDGECWKCPLFKTKTRCPIAWAQMPYEAKEGGDK